MSETETVVSTIRLPAELYEKLKKAAAQDHRNITQTMVKLIEEYVEGRK